MNFENEINVYCAGFLVNPLVNKLGPKNEFSYYTVNLVNLEEIENEKETFVVIKKGKEKHLETLYLSLFKVKFIKEEWTFLSSISWAHLDNYIYNFKGGDKMINKDRKEHQKSFSYLNKTIIVFLSKYIVEINFQKNLEKILLKIGFQKVIVNPISLVDIYDKNIKNNFILSDKFFEFKELEKLEFFDKFHKMDLKWIYDSLWEKEIKYNIKDYCGIPDEEVFERNWVLKIIYPKESKMEYKLKKSSITIGRNEDCDIVLEKIQISKVACTIKVIRGKWIIFDQGCKNGLFKFGNNSYQRINASEMEENSVYCFGSGCDVKHGGIINNFNHLYYAFTLCCPKFEDFFNFNVEEIEQLKQKLNDMQHRVKYFEELKKNEQECKETFPSHWKKLYNLLILDTNVIIDEGKGFIERIIKNNYCLLIPRVVLSELDGLKHKFTDESQLKELRDIIRCINLFCKEKKLHIPSSGVTFQILNKYYNPNIHSKKLNNDEEIVINAQYYSKIFKKKKVMYVSGDTNSLTRNVSNNVQTYSTREFKERFNC